MADRTVLPATPVHPSNGRTAGAAPPLPAAAPTRTEALMDSIRRRIVSGELAGGARLPSLRAMAHASGLSKSTVVEAYDRLVADGVLRSHRGSGFFVEGARPALSLAAPVARDYDATDPLWAARHALDPEPSLLRPGSGWLPASWMPVEALRRAIRRVAAGDAGTLTGYADPLGHEPLRALIARGLQADGVPAATGQIVLVDSATQALDLLGRHLLVAGDCVLVDDPCYFNFRGLLRAHRVRVLGVPWTPDGPDVAVMQALMREHRPRLYLSSPAVHNPTGASVHPVVAHQVVALAAHHDVFIVEDDVFRVFDGAPVTRYAAIDGLQRVLVAGSFTKTVSAAARCGYLALPARSVGALVDLKLATGFGANGWAQRVTADVLTDGRYRHHVEALRTRLDVHRRRWIAKLQPLGIRPWLRPRAGMFLWCELPEGRDSAGLAQQALRHGIVLAPGNVFSVGGRAGRFIRLNVAQCGDPRVGAFLRAHAGRSAAAARRTPPAAKVRAGGPRVT